MVFHASDRTLIRRANVGACVRHFFYFPGGAYVRRFRLDEAQGGDAARCDCGALISDSSVVPVAGKEIAGAAPIASGFRIVGPERVGRFLL